MKKLVLALCIIFALSSFTYNTENEVKEEIVKTESVYVQHSNLNAIFGSCHITITNVNTGETVYDTTVPANSAAECDRLADAALDAFIAGTQQ